jgi:CDP-diacylglycerol--serine O-phosphatidyltransferase
VIFMPEDPSLSRPGGPEPGPEKRRRRGIYLLPNLFTTAALFAGFYAIVAAIGEHFGTAAIAIFVAMILDGVDGRVARLTHTQSAFGAEYDSLSDMVCFGLAPALVAYEWSLVALGKFGWLAAFLYTACAALRLARYNTQLGIADKRYFQGLPSPSAAALMAGFVWLSSDYGLSGKELIPAGITFALAVMSGVLMVSKIRYQSFKELDPHGRVPFVAVLLVVMVFVLISLAPPLTLFTGFLVYASSGPILTLFHVRRRRAERRVGNGSGRKMD